MCKGDDIQVKDSYHLESNQKIQEISNCKNMEKISVFD